MPRLSAIAWFALTLSIVLASQPARAERGSWRLHRDIWNTAK